MAYRASKSGINADQAKKQDAAYDQAAEDHARQWIEAITEEPVGGSDFFDGLRDGSHLCRLLNRLEPGLVSQKYESPVTQTFKQLETIGKFLDGCRQYGLSEKDVFVTLDLHEACNKNMVVATIFALGRTAQKKGYEGPKLGPKEAEGQKREWSEEELRQGTSIVSLQMGTNKVASQQGMTPYGKQRQIYQS
jgi:hypothetical protein